MFDDTFEHFVEEFFALASEARHMVKYVSVFFAETGGAYPSGNGASSCKGEKCSEDERQEESFDLRFEFAVESFGNVVKKFEGEFLSLLKHGSPFGGTD